MSRLRPAVRGVIALGVVGAAVVAFVMVPGSRAPGPAVVAPVHVTAPAQPQAPPRQQPVAPAAVAVEPPPKADPARVQLNRKRASTSVPLRYKTAQSDLDMPLNPYERRPR